MDGADIEGEAESALGAAGLPLRESPRTLALADGLLGAGSVEIVRGRLLTRAALARVDGRWRIYLRAGLDPRDARWCVAHELAEHALLRLDYRGEDAEHVADRLAAAMLAPPRLVVAIGRDVRGVADECAISDTAAALRVGEAGDVPVAVVAPSSVRTRGPESWSWPDPAKLRQLARRAVPGFMRQRLRDDPRRVVLVADEGEG